MPPPARRPAGGYLACELTARSLGASRVFSSLYGASSRNVRDRTGGMSGEEDAHVIQVGWLVLLCAPAWLAGNAVEKVGCPGE